MSIDLFFAEIRRLVLVFSSLAFISSAGAKEASYFEGQLGQINLNFLTSQNKMQSITAVSPVFRAQVRIYQKKKHKVSLGLVTQFIYSQYTSGDSTLGGYVTYTGIGPSLSYQWKYFVLGLDYQFGQITQVSSGTTLTQYDYSQAFISENIGFMHQFGTLSLGAFFTYKSARLRSEKTGLPADYTYSESGILFALRYTFDGSPRVFLRGLFFDD